MQVTVHQAKTQLSKLLGAIEKGEEVIIARRQTPVAELIPFRKKRFKHGILDGVLTAERMPDFFEPMEEEELKLWEGGD
jgi:antitoxin (DNA-binding transcriptional repressor) of toxin-antitoxin stability system